MAPGDQPRAEGKQYCRAQTNMFDRLGRIGEDTFLVASYAGWSLAAPRRRLELLLKPSCTRLSTDNDSVSQCGVP
jgi:hypothetical protein